jgi:hypothetical protein
MQRPDSASSPLARGCRNSLDAQVHAQYGRATAPLARSYNMGVRKVLVKFLVRIASWSRPHWNFFLS